MQYGAHVPMPVEALALPKAPKKRLASREAEERREASYEQAQPLQPGIAAIWREALSTFSAHSAAILMCALIGFALPAIIGQGFYASAKLSEYARTGAVVTLYDRPVLTILLIQVCVGVLALTFARGVITWIVLHREPSRALSREDAANSGSVSEACRITFLRYPMLLAGTLLYGVLIAAGSMATSGLTKSLEFVPSKMAHSWSGPHRAHSDALRQLVWRGLNTLTPDLGLPFADLMPELRHATGLARPIAQGFDPRPELVQMRPTETRLRETWLLAIGGIALLLFAETQLHFRVVMALIPARSPRPGRFGWLTPLLDSARFGVRHFGEITVHVWLVRLAIFGLIVALVEFPVALADHFTLPHVMRLTGSFEILPAMRFIVGAGAALVGAILLAFSTIYDARLYTALAEKVNR